LNHRYALVDLDSGRFLGQISTGYLNSIPLFPRSGGEFYVVETYLSRGNRGERSDVVTIYDEKTLLPRGEVVLPPRRAVNASVGGNAALSDDDRFLAVFNQDPATSLTIVDLRERRVAGEVSIAGCGCVYGAGARRFFSLCQDGALLRVELDERGAPNSVARSEPVFDPESDPLTEKAVRAADRWLFASFEGWLHPIDVSGPAPRALPKWSLFSDEERARGLRVGGAQHLAVHVGRDRLYAIAHEGERWTHKEGGDRLFVYDAASGKRISEIPLTSPGLSFMGQPLEFGSNWIWPFNRLSPALIGMIPPMIGNVALTQDSEPLIVTSAEYSGALVLNDFESGAFLRRVQTGNFTASAVYTPFGARP
jgi:methylamine dehydrogenase heavy chain